MGELLYSSFLLLSSSLMLSPFILLAHFLFMGLASFELLNFAGILKYPLHFSWLALAFITVASWLAWVLTYRPLKRQRQHFLAAQVGILTLSSIYADFLGNLYHFYTRLAWYDQLTHFLGGVSVGALAFAILWYFKTKGSLKLPFFWLALFAICLAVTAGVFYEFEEYLEDRLTGTQKLGSSFDTADDLAWDFLGVLMIIIPFSYFYKKVGA